MEINRTRFALFLRPFSVTRRLEVANPRKSMDPLWPAAIGEPNEIDLETLIADVFEATCPLFGLGEPGEAVGAGRISAKEEEWQLSVKRLAGSAEVILMIPNASAGTKWEIEYLLSSKLLEKCIFLMPPSQRKEIEHAWNESATRLPVHMPQYSSRGMLYVVDSEGRLLKQVPFNAKSMRQLANVLQAVSPVRDVATYRLRDTGFVRFVGFVVGAWALPLLLLLILCILVVLT